jgi:hypothetical protein
MKKVVCVGRWVFMTSASAPLINIKIATGIFRSSKNFMGI